MRGNPDPPDVSAMPEPDPTEDRLYQDAELAQFYDLENDWAADQDYCRELACEARSVLDLGCGTGRLAAELAGGREVVGVDPAEPMLDIAARARVAPRPNGSLAMPAALGLAGVSTWWF